MKKISLSDKQRSQIRFSSTKQGFVYQGVHCRGPRGGQYRDELLFAGCTETGALRTMEKCVDVPWRHPIVKSTIFRVDHLGNVLETLEF